MPGNGRWCGIHVASKHPKYLWSSYNADGLLIATNAFGVWECCDEETCCAAAAAGGGGGRAGAGAGVRCMQTIYPGQIVATYEGELVTNAEAELRRDNQSYLFDLDHFLVVRADPTTTPQEHDALPPLPACATTAMHHAHVNTLAGNKSSTDGSGTICTASHDAEHLADFMESDESPHLVLDAKNRGNVGRFFNHSCSPNLMVQPVFTQGCSALRYRVAFVAVKEVAPGVELCYNYGQRYFFKEGGQVMPCACGAENCQGVLGE